MRSFQKEFADIPSVQEVTVDDSVTDESDTSEADTSPERPMFIKLSAVVAIVLTIFIIVNIAVSSGSGRGGNFTPKVAIIVVESLTPQLLEFALLSRKSVAMQQLLAEGSSYASASASGSSYTAASATILTGLPASVHGVNQSSKGAMKNVQSILQLLTISDLSPLIIAPTDMYSGLVSDDQGNCTQIGLFDAECYGTACPTLKNSTGAGQQNGSCNAKTKTVYCDNIVQRVEDLVLMTFATAVSKGHSSVYLHLDFLSASSDSDPSPNSLPALSEINNVDSIVSRMTQVMYDRSVRFAEAWLLVITSDVFSTNVPLLIGAISNGQTLRLNAIQGASTLDIYPTVAWWMDLSVDRVVYGKPQSICSSGRAAASCVGITIETKLYV